MASDIGTSHTIEQNTMHKKVYVFVPANCSEDTSDINVFLLIFKTPVLQQTRDNATVWHGDERFCVVSLHIFDRSLKTNDIIAI